MKPYPRLSYTGDGTARDGDGYTWIKGRVDGASLILPFATPAGRWAVADELKCSSGLSAFLDDTTS
jgi:hypothetical protein